MDRTEYLKRPLVEGVKYEITDKVVRIETDDTCFISIERHVEKITLQEVEQMFRELKKAAKDTGKIKLKGVSKFLPAVRALYSSYSAANEKMSENFVEIVEIARKLQSDGIHRGYNDDELLNTAFRKQSEIVRLHDRNTDYSIFWNYYQTLQQTVKGKQWEREDLTCLMIRLI